MMDNQIKGEHAPLRNATERSEGVFTAKPVPQLEPQASPAKKTWKMAVDLIAASLGTAVTIFAVLFFIGIFSGGDVQITEVSKQELEEPTSSLVPTPEQDQAMGFSDLPFILLPEGVVTLTYHVYDQVLLDWHELLPIDRAVPVYDLLLTFELSYPIPTSSRLLVVSPNLDDFIDGYAIEAFLVIGEKPFGNRLTAQELYVHVGYLLYNLNWALSLEEDFDWDLGYLALLEQVKERDEIVHNAFLLGLARSINLVRFVWNHGFDDGTYFIPSVWRERLYEPTTFIIGALSFDDDQYEVVMPAVFYVDAPSPDHVSNFIYYLFEGHAIHRVRVGNTWQSIFDMFYTDADVINIIESYYDWIPDFTNPRQTLARWLANYNGRVFGKPPAIGETIIIPWDVRRLPTVHTVMAGEQLISIAMRYFPDLDFNDWHVRGQIIFHIARDNNIVTDHLYAGMELVINPWNISYLPIVHMVLPGEHLGGIAGLYFPEIDLDDADIRNLIIEHIARDNDIPDPAHIWAGMEIVINPFTMP